MTTIPLVNLRRQYATYRTAIDAAVMRVLTSGTYVLGPEVSAFETEFARYCKSRYAVAVGSGTDGLYLSLRALGIGKGDEVLTVANTFVSTAMSISNVGAMPVFVDIDPRTQTMDPQDLAKKISKKAKAIIVVHLFGQPADMDPILALAKRNHLKVIEDACQAHGARYKGKRVGSLGDAGVFSFYPSKNLSSYGDGGVVTTRHAAVAQRLRHLRVYGSTKRDHFHYLGINSRLDEVHAAILRFKLTHLDAWNQRRKEVAERYDTALMGAPSEKVHMLPHVDSAYHLYVIRTTRRTALKKYLADRGIQTGIHYPVPIHKQAVYKKLGYANVHLPHTEQAAREILTLPLCPEISDREIDRIGKAVHSFFHS